MFCKVHRGRLRTGEEVAVKVQYPGLHKAITSDLTCLLCLSRIAAWIFPSYQLGWVFQELRAKICREMDFIREMQNAKSLAQKLEHRQDVRCDM